MVAGMAMAPEAAQRRCGADAVNVSCNMGPSTFPVPATLFSGAPEIIVGVTLSFTPLHIAGRHVGTDAYDVIVWGGPPP